MSKETLKSILLALLVAISMYLTWNIWTYSPNLSEEKDSTEFIQEGAIDDKQILENIIKPYQVMFHQDEELLGSKADDKIDMILDELFSWSLYDYDYEKIASDDMQQYIESNGMTELLFADEVPFSVYKQIIRVEERETPDSGIQFDRILIETKPTGSSGNRVHFISTADSEIFSFKVNSENINAFVGKMDGYLEETTSYIVKQVTDSRFFYLPADESDIKMYTYIPELLDERKFKDALFSTSSSVRHDTVAGGEEYTDGSSRMRIRTDTMTLSYIDPSRQVNSEAESYRDADILQKSIDYVNEHSGWTDDYRFVELSSNNNKVEARFKLFNHDLPVFNKDGMTEVTADWYNSNLTRYTRPIFMLDKYLPSDVKVVTLLSGEAAFSAIKAQEEDFNEENLQSMTIGYTLEKMTEDDRLLHLVPSWYYQYNNMWKELVHEGGIDRGLE